MKKTVIGVFTLWILFCAASPALAQHLGIKDRSLAAEVYDLHLSRLGGTSCLDEAWMRGAIEFTKKSLGVAKETPPNQVFDFSFAEKAWSGIKNWNEAFQRAVTQVKEFQPRGMP